MIPFLVFSLAAIGLNILTGYTGLISLGSGAFMGVGAYACYKLTTVFPEREHHRLDSLLRFLLSSHRRRSSVCRRCASRASSSAVVMPAAQFFLQWSFVRIPWLYNYNASGAIDVPQRMLAGITVTGANATPVTRYSGVLPLSSFSPGLPPISFMAGSVAVGWRCVTWTLPLN